MKKQSLIKGTIILGVAGIIAKFMGLFFRWPLQMLIGDEGVGYYQLSYPLYMFFISIASGIPVAVSKMVSEKNAMHDREGVIQVLRKAMLLMIIMGGSFTILMFSFSNKLITFLKWPPKAYYSLLGIALAPIFIAVMGALRGFFQGLQNMNYTAISQILEQMGRVVIGVGLAYLLLPTGIEFSAGGAAFGAAAGGFIGGSYLLYKYIRMRKEFWIYKVKGDTTVLSKLLYIAIPISLGATVGSVMGLIDSILVPQKLLEAGITPKQATILYGQLTGKAFVLINVPLTLSIALCASLVPIIAEAHILKRREDVVNKVQTAVRMAFVIALPSMLGLYFMAYPVLNLIFPGHAEGAAILKYLSLSIPFIILTQISTAILQGTGKYIRPVINLSIGCLAKVIITFLLVPIPKINVYGAIIGSIAGYVIAATLSMRLMRKNLNTSINYYDALIKPGFASVIMIFAVVFFNSYIYNYTGSSRIACLCAVLIGVILYGIFIIIFGIFNYSYIKKKIVRR